MIKIISILKVIIKTRKAREDSIFSLTKKSSFRHYLNYDSQRQSSNSPQKPATYNNQPQTTKYPLEERLVPIESTNGIIGYGSYYEELSKLSSSDPVLFTAV